MIFRDNNNIVTIIIGKVIYVAESHKTSTINLILIRLQK